MPRRLLEGVHSLYLHFLDQRRLGAIGCRQVENAVFKLLGTGDGCGHGQGAGYGAQGSIQRQLAHQHGFPQLIVVGNLARGGKQPHGDGQVEGGALFFRSAGARLTVILS